MKFPHKSVLSSICVCICASLTANALAQNSDGVKIGSPMIFSLEALRTRLTSIRKILQEGTGLEIKDLSKEVSKPNFGSLSDSSFEVGANFLAQAPVDIPASQISDKPKVSDKTLESPTTNPIIQISQRLNLEFEAINLEFLLAGAANALQNASGSGRGVVVIGLPVSLMPTSQHINRSLTLEFNLKNSANDSESIDQNKDKKPLVMLMLPKERTMNVQKILRRREAAGLGIGLNPVGIFLGGKSGKEEFGIYQDFDTVAYADDSAQSVSTFGWQFRPVLGDPVIIAGQRLLLAVVSLPNDLDPSFAIGYRGTWHEYDKRTRTTGKPVSCFSQGKASIISLDKMLPRLESIFLSEGSKPGTVFVRLHGTGMYPELPFFLAENRLQPTRIGNQELLFEATMKDLVRSPVSFVDAFGFKREMPSTSGINVQAYIQNIKIVGSDANRTTLGISLKCDKPSSLQQLKDFLSYSGIVQVNSDFFRVTSSQLVANSGDGSVDFELTIPTSTIGGSAFVRIAPIGLAGPDQAQLVMESGFSLADYCDVKEISIEAINNGNVIYSIRGFGLHSGDIVVEKPKDKGVVKVTNVMGEVVGSDDFKIYTSFGSTSGLDSLTLWIGKSLVSEGRTIIIKKGRYARTILLPSPEEELKRIAAEEAKRKIPEITPIEVDQFFEGLLKLEGTLAGSVTSAKLGSLSIEVKKIGEQRYLDIPISMTQKPAKKVLSITVVIKGKDGKPDETKEVPLTITVNRTEKEEEEKP